ncbi:MAG: PIG-L family deacetylase [Calditrichia bacterium]
MFAHPDDESFGPAGTIAKYAASGHKIILLTFTRGEAGSLGVSKALGREQLAQRRSKELKCAAAVLGIQDVRILRFPDKALNTVPDEKTIPLIIDTIHEIKPEVVITFHPNGISGHADHKQLTHWATRAISQIRPSPRLMVYGLISSQTDAVLQRRLIPIPEEEITHKIDILPFLEKKIKAIQCHVTQAELWKQLQLMGIPYDEFARWEHFSQVFPPVKKNRIAHDLFEEN